MFTIDITPAKRRFGRKPRKQWQFQITADNGERIDPRDTYANTGDIVSLLDSLKVSSWRIRIHRSHGVDELDLL